MESNIVITRELYDTANEERHRYKAEPGLSEELIREISRQKNEPEWMLQKRLEAFKWFQRLKMPAWGPDLSGLDLNNIVYFLRPDAERNQTDWNRVPSDIKKTFERLGIPEAEQKSLAGAGAQYESDVVYHNLRKIWEEKGVIFKDMDLALQEHEELVKKYFMTQCVPIHDHKFAALHAAVWSGGTFLYVPKGVQVDMPLQAYFRMNAKRAGQFEHTLIIVEEGAKVEYIEGCSAPLYNESSLHAGCVEVYVKEGARARYSSVENWSRNTYNLNTKRAVVERHGFMEWISGNLGSGVTMLYPCSMLRGEYARADHLGVAYAGPGQNQDTGAKVFHMKPYTTSTVKMKSISKGGGITSYRGLLRENKGAIHSKSNVVCDALLMDPESKSNTYPYVDIEENQVDVGHEATVGKVGDKELFYLMSRGLTQEQALKMIVNGFIEPITRELPMEYAVELNKLIEMELEGSVG